MNNKFFYTLLLSLPLIFVQCNQTQDGERPHMMGDEQMGQMMDNPEQRQAIMAQMMQNPEQRQAMMTQMMQNQEQRQAMMSQMMQNPEMRHEFMNRMNSSMMEEDHDLILDRMEMMMNDPERREQIKAHMQQMMAMLENGEFDREQMREMMDQSPMMGMHMNCMQMMSDM